MNNKKKILIMAGGTGGHIFPGLAVAEELRAEGWQIRWLGTKDRMEATLVPEHGIEIDFINISGLRGKGIKRLLLAPFQISKAICQAKRIIKHYRPDVVLGMGGYVSGPGGIAAKLSKVPIVLHEQNGVAGLTNHALAQIATVMLQAFPTAFKNAQVVGNPVRQTIIDLPPPNVRFAERSGAIRVLVMGGSQGAKIINEALPEVAKQLADKVIIWHQVGKGNKQSITTQYGAFAKQHIITEFIDDIADAYHWADIVICRSGALTVSEIEVAGIGAIFVPFQHKDKQQYWNARPLADIGAAWILEQTEFSSQKLIALLSKLDRDQLLIMAEKSSSIAVADSAKQVAKIIEHIKK